MYGMEKKIHRNSQLIQRNHGEIVTVKDEMKRGFTSVDQDLAAIAMDTVAIKRFVGMPVAVD